jgi:hypothetical protein
LYGHAWEPHFVPIQAAIGMKMQHVTGNGSVNVSKSLNIIITLFQTHYGYDEYVTSNLFGDIISK